jgi:hypothetical protein
MRSGATPLRPMDFGRAVSVLTVLVLLGLASAPPVAGSLVGAIRPHSVQPLVVSDSPFDDTTDAVKERVVVLEYLLTQGSPDELSRFAPSPAELAAAQRRLTWYPIKGTMTNLATSALGDTFGGMWIGFDGTVHVAYTDTPPALADFPADARKDLPLAFDRRNQTLDAARSEAAARNAIYDITTGAFVSRDSLIASPASQPAESHTNAYTMAGESMSLRCGNATRGGTAGFRVTWKTSAGQRMYGYLMAGHVFPDACDDNGWSGVAGDRRVISDGDVDVRQRRKVLLGDIISENKIGRGIMWACDETCNDTYWMDAGIVRCETNECGTQRNSIHLQATPKHSGGGNNDPWPAGYDSHNTEVESVEFLDTLYSNDTICYTGATSNGVLCGWFGGEYQDNALIIDFANGSPVTPVEPGDSGSPVYSIWDSDGPLAVGVLTHQVKNGFGVFQFGLFFKVSFVRIHLQSEFTNVVDFRICSRNPGAPYTSSYMAYDCA